MFRVTVGQCYRRTEEQTHNPQNTSQSCVSGIKLPVQKCPITRQSPPSGLKSYISLCRYFLFFSFSCWHQVFCLSDVLVTMVSTVWTRRTIHPELQDIAFDHTRSWCHLDSSPAASHKRSVPFPTHGVSHTNVLVPSARQEDQKNTAKWDRQEVKGKAKWQ